MGPSMIVDGDGQRSHAIRCWSTCFNGAVDDRRRRLQNASVREINPYETPYRPFLPSTAYALAASRHMHEFGTTREQMAEVAVAACRKGEGPYLLEAKTYRYRGHSMSDPARYRPREELQLMRTQHDCIENARQRLAALGVEDKQFKAIDDEVKAIIQDAADFAQASPEPDPSELWTDVLVEA